jgi:hypothetical protein
MGILTTPVIAIGFAFILALIRIWMGFNVPPDTFSWAAAYKDTAHIFIGGLLVAWRTQKQRW